MKRILILILIFVYCTNYHEDFNELSLFTKEDLLIIDQIITETQEETTTEETTTEETTTEETTTEETTTEETTTEETTTEETTTEETTTEETTTEETTTEETTTEETTTEETTTEETTTEETTTEETENGLSETEFINLESNWNPGEPTGNQTYVFMISNTGKWIDHHNTLNDDGYGLFQISIPLSEITLQKFSDYDNFIFLGELNSITYFFSKNIMNANLYLELRPLNGEGRPVILDSEKKINFIVTSHSEYPLKALWIGLRKVNGEWQWLRN